MNLFASLLSMVGFRRAKVRREESTSIGPLADRDFLVPNMVCEGCADRIAGALTSIPGVRGVTSTVPQKRVRVRYEPGLVREQQLTDALARIGFDARDARDNA